MKQRRYRIAGVLAALTAVTASVAAVTSAPAQVDEGVSGRFSAVMMVHTSSSNYGNLPGVNPWNGSRFGRSGFIYRSIPCSGAAPVNNISSDLPTYGTRVQGSRAPASMRAHPMGFRVRKNKGVWEILGSIKFTVCKLGGGPTAANDPVPDSEKPTIRVGFRAPFTRETGELVRWSGRFTITGGTQRYEDLEGSGVISGYFMCFAPAGCTALGGKYLDGQFTMQGEYRDPTPQLTG